MVNKQEDSLDNNEEWSPEFGGLVKDIKTKREETRLKRILKEDEGIDETEVDDLLWEFDSDDFDELYEGMDIDEIDDGSYEF